MKGYCVVRLTMAAIAVVSSSLLPARAFVLHPGDPGVLQRGNSLYKVIDSSNWLDAEAIAESWGGHLVTIETPDENIWINENIVGNPIHQTQNDATMPWTLYFIGYNDIDIEGTFKWSSGIQSTWQPSQFLVPSSADWVRPWSDIVILHSNHTPDYVNIDGWINTDYAASPYTNPGPAYFTNFRVPWNTKGIAEVYLNDNIPAAPGPLPIFGAAAAFGYSRKLRKRIKSQP